MDQHLGQAGLSHLRDMAHAYTTLRMLPTSTVADTFLIRSHIAYHDGSAMAERAIITPSRGSSYRVRQQLIDRPGVIVKIANYFDHRDGVIGWRERA